MQILRLSGATVLGKSLDRAELSRDLPKTFARAVE